MAKRSKKKWMEKHSRQRARERFGIVLDQNTQANIVNDIQNYADTVCLIEKQSNTRSVYTVSMGASSMPVVYDKTRKTIVTVLPAGAVLSTKGVSNSYE